MQLTEPSNAMALAKQPRHHAVATRAVGAGGIQISLPLIATDGQVQDLAAATAAALVEVG